MQWTDVAAMPFLCGVECIVWLFLCGDDELQGTEVVEEAKATECICRENCVPRRSFFTLLSRLRFERPSPGSAKDMSGAFLSGRVPTNFSHTRSRGMRWECAFCVALLIRWFCLRPWPHQRCSIWFRVPTDIVCQASPDLFRLFALFKWLRAFGRARLKDDQFTLILNVAYRMRLCCNSVASVGIARVCGGKATTRMMKESA